MKRLISLQKIGELDNKILINLRKALDWYLNKYNLHFIIDQKSIKLTRNEYDFLKQKYDASLILQNLFLKNSQANMFCSLGVMDKDIFKNYNNFVFGVGIHFEYNIFKFPNLALISITRLKESFYNRPSNEIITIKRSLKEAIHELGHAFGLKHCKNDCVMKFSKEIIEADKKPLKFCIKCTKQLNDLFISN
ncbi:MAG: hypothetical protein P8Y70_04410 [Candidatus Lokiarchaeota archaeon]